MARIELEGMEFYAYHGCYKQEQVVGNRFLVNLSFNYDSSVAQVSDDIEDAVSYLDIYELVRARMSVTSHILEHVGKGIIDDIKLKFPNISDIAVKVTKLSPPLGGALKGVSATIFG